VIDLPIVPFRLSEEAKIRRRDLTVFVSSMIVGACLGVITSFVGSAVTCGTALALIGLAFVVIAVSVYAAKKVLQPRELHDIIPVYIGYNRDDGSLLQISTKHGFIVNSSTRIDKAYETNPDLRSILKNMDFEKVGKFARDIVTYEFLDWLAMKCLFSWAPKYRYISKSGISCYTYKRKDEVPTKVINYEDIPKELRNDNMLLRLFGDKLFTYGRFEFSVPVGTEFVYNKNERDKIALSFQNEYCTITLTIYQREVGVGLSPLWGEFVAVPKHIRKDQFSYLQEHYAHARTEIEFYAKFKWIRSLGEASDDYFNWVEDMFDSLEDYFSFDKEIAALKQSKKKFILG
jgi:hypothetical protein